MRDDLFSNSLVHKLKDGYRQITKVSSTGILRHPRIFPHVYMRFQFPVRIAMGNLLICRRLNIMFRNVHRRILGIPTLN